MTGIPTDTSLEAELIQIQRLRERTPLQRLTSALRLSLDVMAASKRAILRTHPELTMPQVEDYFVQMNFGRRLAGEVRQHRAQWYSSMTFPSELLQVLRPVLYQFRILGTRYYVGGSVASSFHGAPRSTLNVDITAELNEEAATSLVLALRDEYYGSQTAAIDAVRRRSCFNLVHLATSFKVDIFVSKERPFDRSVLDRAIVEVDESAEPLAIRVASAEDILLLKLDWYRLGNEISERQWNDVTMVVKLQDQQLDRVYLRHWAETLGLSDLLERLFGEIESSGSQNLDDGQPG